MTSAVLFDLMGTILVAKSQIPERPLTSLWQRFVQNGLSSTEDDFTLAWKSESRQPALEGHTPFEERICRVAKRLDWQLAWPGIQAIADEVCNLRAALLSVDVDAPAVLRRLSQHMKLGLVTNFDHPPAIYRLLRKHELSEWFSVVTISGEIGYWKPDPRILSSAMGTMDVLPSQCLYVGDSRVDVEAAVAAGVTPVLIIRGDHRIDPMQESEAPMDERFGDLVAFEDLRRIGSLCEVEELISEN